MAGAQKPAGRSDGGAEDAARILDERARRLAQPIHAEDAAADLLEIIVFSLANERYGMETRHVREVLRLTHYTPLPGVPAHVVGVTNLRGEILPIFDLRYLFGLAVAGLSDMSRVVVCGGYHAEFGILVDAVNEVTTVSLAGISPAAAFADRHGGGACIRGITSDATILLDGGELLSDRWLVAAPRRAPSRGEERRK